MKVGDVVEGLPSANESYQVTRSGTSWIVTLVQNISIQLLHIDYQDDFRRFLMKNPGLQGNAIFDSFYHEMNSQNKIVSDFYNYTVLKSHFKVIDSFMFEYASNRQAAKVLLKRDEKENAAGLTLKLTNGSTIRGFSGNVASVGGYITGYDTADLISALDLDDGTDDIWEPITVNGVLGRPND